MPEAKATLGDELDAVHAILAPVLDEPEASKRRTEAAADATVDYSDLDALIELVVAQLHGRAAPFGPGDVVRDRTRQTEPRLPVLEETTIAAPAETADAPPAGVADVATKDVHEPPAIPTTDDLLHDDAVGIEQIDALAADMPPLPTFAQEIAPPPVPKTPELRSPREGPVLPAGEADSHAVNLLYDDIIWLTSIDDWGGALISLERLLVMAKLDGQVKEFIDVNEVKLLNLYESFLGPFDKHPTRLDRGIDNAMPGAYARAEKVHALLTLVDGDRDIQQIFRESPYSPLETCSVISQLRRAGVIEVV